MVERVQVIVFPCSNPEFIHSSHVLDTGHWIYLFIFLFSYHHSCPFLQILPLLPSRLISAFPYNYNANFIFNKSCNRKPENNSGTVDVRSGLLHRISLSTIPS